tara:strand:+ start:701 stop:1081 length:381 start_codon:yes stop_codon:yes gene_type:complete
MSKIIKINSKEIMVTGTCYMGELYCSYAKIVDAIGEPSDMFDNYKSDAEWCLEFDNGMVATIYNWKNGKNYCGEDGLELEDIDEWHIGGNDPIVVDLVNDFIKNSWPVFDDIRKKAQANETALGGV